MLVCFSVSWFFSIGKMIRTRAAAGKSLLFVLVVLAGYSSGLLAKVIKVAEGSPDAGHAAKLIFLYGFNLVVVGVDLVLSIRYGRRGTESQAAVGKSQP